MGLNFVGISWYNNGRMSVTEFRTESQAADRPETPVHRRTEDERNGVRRRRINRLERRWWARRTLNLFIIWHLFALAIWLLPDNSAIVQNCVGLVRPYVVGTGFAQSWSMFSPWPDKLDVYLEAQITYADGEKRSWEFPRMAHMGYAQRYREERWRKMVEVCTHGGTRCSGRPWPATPPASTTTIRRTRPPAWN